MWLLATSGCQVGQLPVGWVQPTGRARATPARTRFPHPLSSLPRSRDHRGDGIATLPPPIPRPAPATPAAATERNRRAAAFSPLSTSSI